MPTEPGAIHPDASTEISCGRLVFRLDLWIELAELGDDVRVGSVLSLEASQLRIGALARIASRPGNLRPALLVVPLFAAPVIARLPR